MKVWLDDIRSAPLGWIQFYWPQDVYPYLVSNLVTEISLDHDLGDDKKGTGYDLLVFLEKKLMKMDIQIPVIHIHTMNIVAKERMIKLREKLYFMKKNII